MILFLSLMGCFSRMVVGAVAPQGEISLNSSDDSAWSALYAGAESLDVSVRLLSAHDIVRYRPEPSGGDFTQRFLLDPSPYVQRAALQALLERLDTGDDSTALALLIDNLHRGDLDPYTWGHLAHSLVDVVEGEDTALIGTKWESESASYLVLPLALAAAEVGNTAALAALTAAIEVAEVPLELTFFDDCGEADLPISETIMESFERLEQVLHIPAVVCALELGEESAEADLRERIRSTENPEQALEVLDFLVEANTYAGEGAVHRLLTEASNSSDPIISAYGQGALLSFGEGDPGVVIEFATSIDRDVRVIAFACLTRWWDRFGHTSTRQQRLSYHKAIIDALDDTNIVVVLAAIEAIGHFAHPDDTALMDALLESEDSMVRVRAASALLRLRRRAIFWEG